MSKKYSIIVMEDFFKWAGVAIFLEVLAVLTGAEIRHFGVSDVPEKYVPLWLGSSLTRSCPHSAKSPNPMQQGEN